MTSPEFTQAQGLGYTRGMYRVPLSILTYDSVIKYMAWFYPSSSPGHFPPPTWPGSVYDLAGCALHQSYRYVCLVCTYQNSYQVLSNCSVKKM